MILEEMKAKVKMVSSRFEALKLKEELEKMIATEAFRRMPDSEKDALLDLLAEACALEEQFRGCNPWKGMRR